MENWIQEWYKITDAQKRRDYLSNIPDNIKNDPRLKEIEAWSKVRYFYVDKKETRIGDKFIWILLSLRGQYRNKVGIREAGRIYTDTFSSQDAKHAFSLGTEELKKELQIAADTYVSTVGDPPKLLGIIPREDKTVDEKQARVAKIIIDGHLLTIWGMRDIFGDNAFLLSKALYQAGINNFSEIAPDLEDAISMCNEEGFKAWIEEQNLATTN